MFEDVVAEIGAEQYRPERQVKAEDPDYRKALAVRRRSDYRIIELKVFLADEFGKLHGWRVSRGSYGLETLRRGLSRPVGDRYDTLQRHYFDHPLWYREPGRTGRIAAIVSHLYEPPFEKIEFSKYAESKGLELWTPNFFPSWHFPGVTKLCVWLGPVGRLTAGNDAL